MLSRFQARYPTGNLISKLLQIYEGKFVVQVEVQVDGVTRATGLAAAETLELAEDRARSRALMVLLVETSPSAQPESPVSPVSPEEKSTSAPAVSFELKGKEDGLPLTTVQTENFAGETSGMITDTQKENSKEQTIPFENGLTESHDYSYQDIPALEQTHEMIAAREPVDLSEVIARTSRELKRLGWSNQQGRKYLEQNYSKRSRQELSDKELLEFLEYLESQPSPNQLPLMQ